MSRDHTKFLLTTFCGGLAVVLLTGCELLALLPTPMEARDAAETPELVSVSGNTATLAKPSYPLGALINPPPIIDPNEGYGESYTLVAIDLDSMTTAAVDAHYNPYAVYRWPQSVSDGTWTARFVRNGGFVRVTNATTGEIADYFTEADDSDSLQLYGIYDGRLVVLVERTEDRTAYLVVIDLTSGEQLLIDRVYDGDDTASIAVDGDRIAFAATPNLDPTTPLSSEFFRESTLDLVDLTTGERTELLDVPIRADWYTHRLAFTEGRLQWVEWASEEGNRIKSFDLQTRETTTIGEFGIGVTTYGFSINFIGMDASFVFFVREQTTLVRKTSLNIATYESEFEYVVYRFDSGEETVILEGGEDSLLFPGITRAAAALTDDFAIVYDSIADNLVVYNLATGDVSRVALFGR